MNVLITGGAGFLGRWIVKNLINHHNIFVIDNYSNSEHNNIIEFINNKNFTFLKGNILDKRTLNMVFKNIDACIHLASKVNVQESLMHPESHFDNNIVGTFNIIEESRKHDTDLLICGTCMVYDLSLFKSINENSKIKPKSPYAGFKLAAENMALSYHYSYGLNVNIVRPFNIYGPFQKSNMEGGVVNIFIYNYLFGKDLLIYGDGNQTRDFLYVEDCANFIIDLIEKDHITGEIFNIGTGNDIKIKDLASLICRDLTRIKYIPHIHPEAEINKLVCDASKAKKLLGWYPKITLKEGILKTISWMKSQYDDKNDSE